MSATALTPRWGMCSDVGCARELNEDAVIARPPVFAVADGMGGHAAGEVAAAITVENLSALAASGSLHPEDVQAALTKANEDIVRYGSANPSAAGLGSTVSGVCLGVVADVAHWIVFNIGDSRVYRATRGDLFQVTNDHSEVAELIAAGQLTREQARTHPNRNVITLSLGSDPCPVADTWVLPAAPGDRFVICSDGLTSEVDDIEIRDVVNTYREEQAAADELLHRALSAGGHDNVSVVVLSLAENDSPTEDDTVPRGKLAGARHA